MPEQPLSTQAVYRARPTVRIDTQEYPKVSELLIGMAMTEREGGMSALELLLSNVASEPGGGADLAFEDDAILRLGAAVAVYTGDETAPREIFRGIITGLEADYPNEAPPELTVLAEDALQQARMTRRTAVHDDVSLADLATALADELGLTPVVSGLSNTIGTWVQLNESDLAFLRRLLARYDSDLQVVGDELHVSARSDVARGELELALHSQLRSAKVTADLAHQVSEVTVTGWNAEQGERVSGRSNGSDLGPGTGTTGAQILQDAIVERSHHIAHLAVASDREAQAAADAAFDDRARRLMLLDGTADGNPAVRVGANVTVTGLGGRFDNTYYVVQACHRWDVARGYETDFQAECAYWGGSP